MTNDFDLTDLANHFGSDKGTATGDWGVAHGYTATYEKLLAPRRLEPLRVLELGVWKGASLQMWERFFPNAQIIGVDNLVHPNSRPLERAEVLIGDATNPEFLRSTISRFPGSSVDIIIDDASHVLEHQIESCQLLFPHLAPGGLYFVEDIAGTRFSEGNRGLTRFRDFLDYASALAVQTTFFAKDNVQAFHSTRQLSAVPDELKQNLTASYWNQHLASVQFFYNLVVFEKRVAPLSLDPSLRVDPSLQPAESTYLSATRAGSALSSLEGNPSSTLEQLQQQKDLLEGRLNFAESRCVQLASSYNGLKSEKDHLLAWTSALERKNSDLQVTDPQREQQLEGEQPIPGQLPDRARKSLKESWDLVLRFQAETAGLRGILQSAQSEIGVLRVQHLDAAKVRAQLKAKSARLADAEQSRADIQTQLDEIRAQFDKLIEQNRAHFQNQLEHSRAEFKTEIEQTRAELESQLADSRNQVRRGESEITAARISRSQLQARLEIAASEISTANAEQAVLQTRFQNSEIELAATQREQARLKSKLANVESDLADARKDLTSMQMSKSWALTKPMRDFTAFLSRR